MHPEEVYKKFLIKVNKNDTNANVKIPKAQFVLLFNEQKRKWLNKFTENEDNSDYIDNIKSLLEPDVELIKKDEDNFKVNYYLPSNFFRRASSFSIASKDCCKNKVLINWFYKPKDKNVLFQNDNYNPSFEYGETFVLLNKNVLSVFKSDFILNNVYLTYYREPLDINIKGYTQFDGQPSIDVEVDLDDLNIEEIIDMTATEAARIYENQFGVQSSLQREQLKK